MTVFSKKQQKAIEMVQILTDQFGKDKWFIQEELPGITLHTMKALVEKGYIKEMEQLERPFDAPYYQVV